MAEKKKKKFYVFQDDEDLPAESVGSFDSFDQAFNAGRKLSKNTSYHVFVSDNKDFIPGGNDILVSFPSGKAFSKPTPANKKGGTVRMAGKAKKTNGRKRYVTGYTEDGYTHITIYPTHKKQTKKK